jgi:Cdc6-like AAA superfamily ATPase
MPDIMSILLLAANQAKSSGSNDKASYSLRKGLDPQKVKSDINKALADPSISKDLIAVAEEILEKKRVKTSTSNPAG